MPDIGAPRRVLDLGCGQRKLPGAVGMDRVPGEGVDVVHDLNEFPYPFEDSSFDEIHLTDVIEHVGEIRCVMEEIHRIGRPGASVYIATPHFSSEGSYRDPAHRWHLSVHSFDYFATWFPYNWSTVGRFEIVRRHVRIAGIPRYLGIEWLLNHTAEKKIPVLRGLRKLWERHFCWIAPGRTMRFHLRVVKDAPAAPTGKDDPAAAERQ